ncbi:hypothetical protein ABT117_16935 [Streptomyces sp. NPDC002262]|uniref:hypothetical protein n=1 Tax=Streptomyces sp. NPDC002262 TaxID=3154414 RepID=UPI0033321A38
MSASVAEPLEFESASELMNYVVRESAGSVREPAPDMADLASVIRALLDLNGGQSTRVPLGGGLFDAVITAAGPASRAVADLMDQIQNGCGPVIEDPENGLVYWLVPPGSAERWAPHSHAVCLGAPYKITLPALHRTVPPGAYWLRPETKDRLVPVGPLRQALDEHQPEPAPHADFAARFGTPH